MEIRQVNINKIQIPEIKTWQFEVPVINKVPKPIINYAGCVKVHRNNLINLIDVDENGTVIKCGVKMPSYEPLQWTPNSFVYSTPPQNTNISPPSYMEAVKPEIPNKKKEKEFFVPCPDPESPLRVGSFANDDRIEKIKSFYYNEDKTQCLIEWEEVTYFEKLIPSIGQFTSVFTLALVGCSAPIVLNLVKPLVKKAIAKLQKSKDTKTSKQD